jgi:hypothetical protein
MKRPRDDLVIATGHLWTPLFSCPTLPIISRLAPRVFNNSELPHPLAQRAKINQTMIAPMMQPSVRGELDTITVADDARRVTVAAFVLAGNFI